MRIVHVVNHCKAGNGNVHVAIDLACAQAQAGHSVTFLSGTGDFVDLLARNNIEHILAPHSSKGIAHNLSALGILRRRLSAVRPDVVHAHMVASALLASVAIGRRIIPLVVTMHNSFDKQSALLRVADRIVAVSMAEHASLVRRGFRVERLSVVLNGTEGSQREAFLTPDEPVSLTRPCVTTACGLHGRKGADIVLGGFIGAARANPNWHFYLMGEGSMKPRLEAQAKASGFDDRIHIIGFRNQPRAILEQSDIFVLGSYAEPCCLVISEARHAGCAIIATDVGGNPELVDLGSAGRLVPPGNPAAFAKELHDLMQKPEVLAQAKAAAKQGTSAFVLDRVRADYDLVYQAAINLIAPLPAYDLFAMPLPAIKPLSALRRQSPQRN